MSEWRKEKDPILSDLSRRFMGRRLFKYVEHEEKVSNSQWMEELKALFLSIGIDPHYYLAVDSPSDLPYDVYRAGDEERVPILILFPNGKVEELSRCSTIVEAISGKRRYDHKLYYPQDLLEDGTRDYKVVKEIYQKLTTYK